jgi:complement component 1 Q subcomponent-binding protein
VELFHVICNKSNFHQGPPFNNLDEDLQILLEKYLEERGINTRLALFIPDYIDHKEQKEYIKWLNNVKNFVA